MDFSLGQDRQMLADMIARYLNDQYPFETRQRISASAEGFSREHWTALAELGVVGALFDESVEGFGGAGFDIGLVFAQTGKALVVEPFLGTLMAGRALGAHPIMSEVISGEAIVTFAHEERESRYNLAHVGTRAARSGDTWLLSGAKAVTPQLESADHIVVSARTAGEVGDEAGISLFLVAKGASGLAIRGYPMIDGGRGGDLELDATPGLLLGEEGRAFDVIEAATAAGLVGLVHEAVAVMDELKSATLEYLRVRKQFGIPIGKFQALQHRMATVALEIEQARSSAINAAAALDGERRLRERAASAAKFTIGRVGTLVAEEAIQMHGGIGMTWELPVSHYAKRLTMIGHQLGDEDHHLQRFSAFDQDVAA